MRLNWSTGALVAFLVVVAVAPVVAPQFWVTLGNYIGLYSIVALGLVLLTGVAGQTSFGQAAFVGLGAYTSAYLTTRYGTSPWLTLASSRSTPRAIRATSLLANSRPWACTMRSKPCRRMATCSSVAISPR